MKIKKILSILMIATFTSAMPVSVGAVPPKSGNSQKSEQNGDVMPFMNEYDAAKLAINDVSKNLQPRTNIHPSSKKYYDTAYQRAKKEKLNRQGFDDGVKARPQAKFEDKQHSDWYNEGFEKGKIMYAYNAGVDDGAAGRPNRRDLFAGNLQSLQNYDRGRLRGINIFASEDREKKMNRRNMLTDSNELALYDKVYSKFINSYY